MKNYENEHRKRVERYAKRVDRIYKMKVEEIVFIGSQIKLLNDVKPFMFKDYPVVKRRVDALIDQMKKDVNAVILNGITEEWKASNVKNNALVNEILGDAAKQSNNLRYFNNNTQALEAFSQRKTAGMKLSDRVWKYTDQFKAEIEIALDLGLGSGISAAEMTKEVKGYLKEPNKLFRRVADKRGVLQLSKNAAAYHPGQGVYRSSYKNALRLTRTETNMAYRAADFERWQQLDFVVGIEVKLSNNHPVFDICDYLKGQYPKTFKFTGWHPQCRCHVITILKTPEEIDKDTDKILNGEETDSASANAVKGLPDNFKKWLKDNSERISKAKSLPYFMRDNLQYVKL